MPLRPDAISPDGRWLVTTGGGAALVEVATGRLIAQFAQDAIRLARFSPESKRVITGSFMGTARIWLVPGGEPITPPMQHGGTITHAEFSPNGRMVVTSSVDGTARIWDTATGAPLTKPLQHRGEVLCAKFSPDNRCLVTASWWDHAALVWDVESGLPLSEPLRHNDWVNYAAFSPDGRWIVSAGNDRNAKLWEIPLANGPVPAWLPELVEAIVGVRLNDGLPEHVPVEALVSVREEVNALRWADDYTRWAQWIFADRSTRAPSPLSAIPRATRDQ